MPGQLELAEEESGRILIVNNIIEFMQQALTGCLFCFRPYMVLFHWNYLESSPICSIVIMYEYSLKRVTDQ